MVLSTFIAVAAFGLSGVVAENHLPANSAISFEQLRAAFGTDLPPIEIAPTTSGERRRLELPDMYYDKCVFWINAARSREGLPALQRWRDFEPCSDRGAKYDSNANSFHASISRGMYCDWSNYFPIAQNTCPHWFHDGDSMESCTMAMWHERDFLEKPKDETDGLRRRLGADELLCKDGRSGEYCAGHYFNLRGGSKGYNAYDRVACGFFVEGSTIWINQNFGSGVKTDPSNLLPPSQWTSPKGWSPEDFKPYGFACGGDEATRPVTLLDEQCDILPDPYQYDDCTAEYRQDYRWHGCLAGTCDEKYSGPCKDFTVGTTGNLVLNGSGEDICSGRDLEAPCVDPYAINFPKGSRVWHKTREVCRRSCGTCACTTKPFDEGFRPENHGAQSESESSSDSLDLPESPEETPAPEEPEETPEPSEPETEATPEPEPEEEEPASNCGAFAERRKCVKEVNCQWNRKAKCVQFDGNCAALKKQMCSRSWGCKWNNTARPRHCSKAE